MGVVLSLQFQHDNALVWVLAAAISVAAFVLNFKKVFVKKHAVFSRGRLVTRYLVGDEENDEAERFTGTLHDEEFMERFGGCQLVFGDASNRWFYAQNGGFGRRFALILSFLGCDTGRFPTPLRRVFVLSIHRESSIRELEQGKAHVVSNMAYEAGNERRWYKCLHGTHIFEKVLAQFSLLGGSVDNQVATHTEAESSDDQVAKALLHMMADSTGSDDHPANTYDYFDADTGYPTELEQKFARINIDPLKLGSEWYVLDESWLSGVCVSFDFSMVWLVAQGPDHEVELYCWCDKMVSWCTFGRIDKSTTRMEGFRGARSVKNVYCRPGW